MIENVKDCGSIHLFRDISRDEIEKMFRCSKTVERCFEDGMYIFRQGETPQNLFLVLEGAVMISKDFCVGKAGCAVYGGAGRCLWGNVSLCGYESVLVRCHRAGEGARASDTMGIFYCFCSNACEHHRMITRNMLEIQSEKILR